MFAWLCSVVALDSAVLAGTEKEGTDRPGATRSSFSTAGQEPAGMRISKNDRPIY
jgi:hypothetical protein